MPYVGWVSLGGGRGLRWTGSVLLLVLPMHYLRSMARRYMESIPIATATVAGIHAAAVTAATAVVATVAGAATGLLVAGLFSTKFSDFPKKLW